MKALSIRQPWAWLIARGFKPIENRTWNTRFRGRLLIHASKAFDKDGYEWVRDCFPEIALPLPEQFERGGIVGSAELYEVETASASPWFFGQFGFRLGKAEPLPFVPLAGKLGFFEAPHHILPSRQVAPITAGSPSAGLGGMPGFLPEREPA